MFDRPPEPRVQRGSGGRYPKYRAAHAVSTARAFARCGDVDPAVGSGRDPTGQRRFGKGFAFWDRTALHGDGARTGTARAATGRPETRVGALCREPGVARRTLRRRVGPKGEPRPDGEKRLAVGRRGATCG